MITLTTTHQPATDLGYLLHKNPTRNHVIELTFGQAWCVFPEADLERCTAAVMLDVDPVKLVRGTASNIGQYVNDRPYTANSLLCTALSRLFGTAMSGRCKDRPDLVEVALPFEVEIPVVMIPGGAVQAAALFEPLGYEVEAQSVELDEKFPEWGASPYFTLRLKTTQTLQTMLSHLVVLIAAMDARKHHFVGEVEIDKLIRRGEGWLEGHPEKEWIVRRYLRSQETLTRQALERLKEVEEEVVVEAVEPAEDEVRRESLHRQRHDAVIALVRERNAKSVVDLGCGDGKLMQLLMKVQGLERIVGMDVSWISLERASRRLRLDDLAPKARERVSLIHGSLLYRDSRLNDFDFGAVVEVIEHLDPPRLAAFERVVFERARPQTVVVTTPNREYNAVYGMEDAVMRHDDHRFEWTRAEFASWCHGVATVHGYEVSIHPIGDVHDECGAGSQMGVFVR
jgi:3' terminal RNA ribose 2'-O-methyltransferase Hen1